MAPQCISGTCWCCSWPLLGHQAEVGWAESAVQGYHDVGQPAHDGGSHSSGRTVEGTAAPTPAWSVPWCWRAWLARLRAPGQGLDPVAVFVNQPSVPPESSSTLSQFLQTAPLYCLLFGVWLFYFQSCSQLPDFVGERGGEWGKPVGSMNEKSQVSGCYNITFNYTNQETVSVLEKTSKQNI